VLDLIVGAVLGTLSSFVISHFYYRRSSRELDGYIQSLHDELETVRSLTSELQAALSVVVNDTATLRKHSSVVINDTAMIRKHSVEGTPDDPDYPYK